MNMSSLVCLVPCSLLLWLVDVVLRNCALGTQHNLLVGLEDPISDRVERRERRKEEGLEAGGGIHCANHTLRP